MEGDGWKFALMLRLSPIPSWLNTYGLAAFGKITFRDFFLATILGSIPMVIQNVSGGALLMDISTLDSASELLKGNRWHYNLSVGLLIFGSTMTTTYIFNYLKKINS